jgi:ABC-type spermidine/putrescine transport system permease subunit II
MTFQGVRRAITDVVSRCLEAVLAWVPALLLVAPLVLLAVGAFSETWDSRGPRGATLASVEMAWRFAGRSAAFSLWIAALSAVIATLLAVPAAFLLAREASWVAKLLRPALSLPVVLPNLLLAMGLMLAFPALQGGWLLLLVAYVIQSLPYALWPMVTALLLLDLRSLESAGRVLGANARQRFLWLVLPNIARPAAVGAVTVFILVLAESSSSFFLASGAYQPFGVTLYNAFQDLDLRVAAATIMLLLGMLAPAVILLELWLSAPRRAAPDRAATPMRGAVAGTS